jgi:hypothetical protein
MEYSRTGMLALMWRAIYADGTYDIWSSLSRDGGKSFSQSVRVSHALSQRLDRPVECVAGFDGCEVASNHGFPILRQTQFPLREEFIADPQPFRTGSNTRIPPALPRRACASCQRAG